MEHEREQKKVYVHKKRIWDFNNKKKSEYISFVIKRL